MQPAVIVRWAARIWSVASTLCLLAFILPGEESMRPTASEAVGLLFFPVGVVAGFAIAWWREAAGGAITVGSVAIFYLWMFSRDGRLPAGPWFLLFAAPGFLFLAAALWSRSSVGGTVDQGSPGKGPSSQPRS